MSLRLIALAMSLATLQTTASVAASPPVAQVSRAGESNPAPARSLGVVTYQASGTITSSESPMPSFGYAVGSAWTAVFEFDTAAAQTGFPPSANALSHFIVGGILEFSGAGSSYQFSGASFIVEDGDFSDIFSQFDDAVTFFIESISFTATENDVGADGFGFTFQTGVDDIIDNVGVTEDTFEVFSRSTGIGVGTFLGTITVLLDIAEMKRVPSDAQPCSAADVGLPLGLLDIADIVEFLQLFGAQSDQVDFSPPEGVFDIADVVAFLQIFSAGCP